jgi:23S rRNA pseudouridine2605 synthase
MSTEKKKKGERVAKVIAHAGLCSRRDAERWIADGRVRVNGETLTSPAVTVTDDDAVQVDGKPLPRTPDTRLWRYHKPPGLVTTHKDPEGRPTVFDTLPKELGRVISVGRLDLNSEGLLLLTNDGELARKLEHPSTALMRRYRVRVHGHVTEEKLAGLADGVTVDGVTYGAVHAHLDKKTGRNAWLTVDLFEGKNREVRRVMEHIGLKVNRLLRVSYGLIELGELKRGELAEVPGNVVRRLTRERKPRSAPKPRKPRPRDKTRPTGPKKAPARKRAAPRPARDRRP